MCGDDHTTLTSTSTSTSTGDARPKTSLSLILVGHSRVKGLLVVVIRRDIMERADSGAERRGQALHSHGCHQVTVFEVDTNAFEW